MGVDQTLSMTVVIANGTVVEADYAQNKDLFRAMRGGGPGFGIVTELKIKLHKVIKDLSIIEYHTNLLIDQLFELQPQCTSMKDCYHMHLYIWNGTGTDESVISFLKSLTKTYIDFSIKSRTRNWNSVISIFHNSDPNIDEWKVEIGARYFGNSTDDHASLFQTRFQNYENEYNFTKFSHPNLDKYWCDASDTNGELDCVTQETHTFSRIGFNIPFFMYNLNKKMAQSDEFLNDLFATWSPLCKNEG